MKKTIWSYYRIHKRDMPWRSHITPYRVIVSEIMLQQTQASRVIPKFNSFMRRFPNWKSLARASVKKVLSEWSGLGYNRRALYLKRIAEVLVAQPQFDLHNYNALQELPGIGSNTAGSILAFAFNKPQPFIETNIRSVYIHFFFGKTKRKIHDNELFPFIEKDLISRHIHKNPREWYYALMDYGAYLKSSVNPSQKSAHHVRQKPFKGSNRELRSKILKIIMHKQISLKMLGAKLTQYTPEQISKNIHDLTQEGFLKKSAGQYTIA